MLPLILYLCYNCVTVEGIKKGYTSVALSPIAPPLGLEPRTL